MLGLPAAAGQALGPVLAGGAGGDIDQAAANIDTACMILQGAFRMHRGDSPSTLDVILENRGDNVKSAAVRVTRPAGTSFNLSSNIIPMCGLAQAAVMVSGGIEVDTYLPTAPAAPAICNLHADVTVGTAEPLGSFNVNIVLEEIP